MKKYNKKQLEEINNMLEKQKTVSRYYYTY